ncbi:hypothetical protein GGI21_003961, partial [Coemansia aciculifera]
MLLLPPGTDLSTIPGLFSGGSMKQMAESDSNATLADPCPLRTLLIGWMTISDDDRSHLALNTLRLFDTILSTLNQFAFTSLVLRNFVEADTNRGGPALGMGVSAPADQELVRAVVERFLDAAPSNIANAMPEVVVSTAMRMESGNEEESSSLSSILPTDMGELLPSRNNYQAMCSQIMRDNHGCDEYVDDCLRRVRANRHYILSCWKPSNPAVDNGIDRAEEDFYPGAFLASLVTQFSSVVKRHMAYNLMLTSMVNKLACIGDPALTAFLFLANSATMTPEQGLAAPMLYDSLVAASADAYVKSERVPRFPARLARQRYEGVETAIKVGAAHPMSNENRKTKEPFTSDDDNRSSSIKQPPSLSSSGAMDVDSALPAAVAAISVPGGGSSREDVARAVRFLGTPIKRFVHGFIVLDEFAKEMAATALALHTIELDRQLTVEQTLVVPDVAGAVHDEYADLLEYFDPEEPAYRRAAVVVGQMAANSLKDGDGIIELLGSKKPGGGKHKGGRRKSASSP